MCFAVLILPFKFSIRLVCTLTKFLDDCDNSAFREAVNNNPILAEAFVGHQNNWTKADYEALADDLNLVTTDTKTQELISNWMDRSGKITNFGNVVKLGNSLSKKIVAAIKSKKGKLFDDLAKETGIPLDQLKNYDVLTEVPLETTGGFMRADAVLIKRNVLGKIDDVIIIENKLSQGTQFTIRQKEGFSAIINGQKEMKIKYTPQDTDLLNGIKSLQVSKDKIFKIADHGADNVSNTTIEKIIKVN